MTTQEFKQMRKMFPKGWEYSDIPAYIRRRDKEDVKEYIAPEYFAPGEFDEDISPEYRRETDYIDHAVEEGKEKGREITF